MAADQLAPSAGAEAEPTSSSLSPPPRPSPTSSGDSVPRKRKAHKKSRKGCTQCKLRAVRCDGMDERRSCNRCLGFGIDCSLNTANKGLRFAGESTFAIAIPSRAAPSSQQLILGSISAASARQSTNNDSSDEQSTTFPWRPLSMEILSRFQERTVLTVGTRSVAKVYQKEVLKLAVNYPFLGHIVSCLTLLHDRHLAGLDTIGKPARTHWSQGSALFRKALDKPESQLQRDALWASAAMLGCIQFAMFEARSPEQAWPLRPAADDDLDWLNVSDKKAVWEVARTTNPDSLFNSVRGHPVLYGPVQLTCTLQEQGRIEDDFFDIFDLGPSANGEVNPYYDAAKALERLLPVECNGDTVLGFMMFITTIHSRLKALLKEKDPRALLLVACWYAKIYRYQWWIYKRGLLEGQAICIYLDRHYSHATSLQRLLDYAKRAFQLNFASDIERVQEEPTEVSQLAPVLG